MRAVAESDVVALWKRAAERYDTEVPYFRLMGERIVKCAAIQAEERVLDVACGAGACLVPAAGRSAGATTVGVDIIEAMVRRAVRNAAAESVVISAAVMDAESLGLRDGCFDVVTCGFGLGFFGTRGLREMRRVLRGTGRVVATVRGRRSEGWDFFDTLCAKYALVNQSYRSGRQATNDAIESAFIRAGFTRPVRTVDSVDVTFDDEEAWWRWMWSHGERGFLERLAPAELEAFRREAYEHLQVVKTDYGLPMTQDFLVFIATPA